MRKIKIFKFTLLVFAVIHITIFILLQLSSVFFNGKTRQTIIANINEDILKPREHGLGTVLRNEIEKNTSDQLWNSTTDVIQATGHNIKYTPSGNTSTIQRKNQLNKTVNSDHKTNYIKEYISYNNIIKYLNHILEPSHSDLYWCHGHFISIGHNMAYLKDVVLDRTKIIPSEKGGETINETIDQSEDSEFYQFRFGAFNIQCKNASKINLNFRTPHLQNWFECLRINSEVMRSNMTIKGLTFAIKRNDYAHLYFMLMELYDAFIIMKMLSHTFNNTNLLILDAHPQGHMDSLLEKLFQKVYRLKHLPKQTKFENLIWGFPLKQSQLLDINQKEQLYLKQFRETILKQFGINSNRNRSCQALNILFVWRHNYVAHPRNKKGIISRKITNENELLKVTHQTFSEHNIQGVQLDKLEMSEQLKIISKTDVLIGMHGAALAFSIFLPPGGAVIELFPSSSPNWHFEYFTKWNNCFYLSWHNKNKSLFDSDGTSMTVPINIVMVKLKNAIAKMCQAKKSE